MAAHIFLASTPFNVITSAMVAGGLPKDESAELWIIDQPSPLSRFMLTVEKWETSPFVKISHVTSQAKRIAQKLKRRKTLRSMSKRFNNSGAINLYTCNDRRIEFQWLMAHAPKITIGHYIDDGTYSYIGRRTNFLKDQIIDNGLKKITYGCWWQQPKDIGASDWISHVHVAFQKHITPSLKSKIIHNLPSLDSSYFQSLAALFDIPTKLIGQADVIALLPHKSVMNISTQTVLIDTLAKAKHPLIKNHPRNDSIPTQYSNFKEIRSDLPFEILLPLLDLKCKIIGDVSTALLTAKWIHPEREVAAISVQDTELSNLMQTLNIEVINVN